MSIQSHSIRRSEAKIGISAFRYKNCIVVAAVMMCKSRRGQSSREEDHRAEAIVDDKDPCWTMKSAALMMALSGRLFQRSGIRLHCKCPCGSFLDEHEFHQERSCEKPRKACGRRMRYA